MGHPARALRRDVPRRAGRLHGRRRPAVHRRRPWIVSGYILGYGGLLLLGGRAADLLGRRQVFLIALGIRRLRAAADRPGGFIKGLSAAFTAPARLSNITIALLTVFVTIERRTANPLIRLGVLRSGSQVRAQLGAAAFFGSYVGFQFLVTQYMQSLLGWSALQTALAFLPAGVLVALSSTKIGDVVDRFGTPRVIAAGFTFLVVGYGLFLRITLTPSYAAVILPSMLLLGAACALTFPSLNIQATNGVDDDEQGMVSGLLNTSIQVGGAIFLAVVTAVITAHGSGDGSSQAVLDSYRPGLVVVTAIAFAGLLITLTGLRRRRPVQHSVPVASSEGDRAAAEAADAQQSAAQKVAVRD